MIKEPKSFSGMEQQLISIRGAFQNNLKKISLEIPHNQLIVVTGVSGSGKSSLAFDVIAKEGQRRYLETFSTFSRAFTGKLSQPKVDFIGGLSPVITLSQKTVGNSSRSTVGTMSDLYDMLRLLFARLGKADPAIKLSRSLFSFNTPLGACSVCNGLGLEEKISVEKLVTYPEKSLREGALAPTQPNGYIMYSQVTVEVLNQICQAHGFNIDIPWNQLTEEQQQVILYGSTLLKVPFGKHPLENRLKWTGITAKPREEDYYKGIMTIMNDILRRDRNDSILRFVESVPCSACLGKRLNKSALSVTLKGNSIDQLCERELSGVREWLLEQKWTDNEFVVASPVIKKMTEQIDLMIRLGIGHLTLNRPASTLSGGESQRIRLINQIYAELSNILYVFDEPTIGLHPFEKEPMLQILRKLVNNGNTVMVVEHDETTIRYADWIIDIGPGAAESGGNLLFNGKLSEYLQNTTLAGISPTWDFLHSKPLPDSRTSLTSQPAISLQHCSVNNLKDIDILFFTAKLNVVTGVSGSGKASLVHQVLERKLREYLDKRRVSSDNKMIIQGMELIDKLITIDQAPIGRTPRSNPATYTGLADKLRDLFSRIPDAVNKGYTRSHFSFNTTGGRCENCQGAGSLQIGMHFLGNIDIVCPECNGKRFHDDILQIRYQDKNMADVLELSVDEAITFFNDQPSILRYLSTLKEVGLGYLHLGQASSTLSGGEAQRIKLATELQQKDTGRTLYIFDEPTTGLHAADIDVLVTAFQKLTDHGNTIICIEQDEEILRKADHLIVLGPGSGENGGRVMFHGHPTLMPQDLVKPEISDTTLDGVTQEGNNHQCIELRGVTTHFLKNIDVRIPKNQVTVITGVSGSGKTSLAFDTLFSEARSRFIESLSAYTRSLLQQTNPAQLAGSSGLGPVVAVSRKYLGFSSRSTVGTITGIYDHYRLLYSRLAQWEGKDYTAGHFSFNNELGACPQCSGLGHLLRCTPEKLITNPEKSILNGAMSGHKAGQFYGDPYGQYISIVKAVSRNLNINAELPWNELSPENQQVILYGTGDQIWEVNWEYKNKTRSGEHHMKSVWAGFCKLVDDEYQRKHLNKNTRDIEDLLDEILCPLCNGGRLKLELLEVKLANYAIAALTAMTVDETLNFFTGLPETMSNPVLIEILAEVSPRIIHQLVTMKALGLSYLTLNRDSRSLSGGEGQRLRLAGALSAQLYGVTYVFDEPSIGLHPKDIIPLVGVIKRLVSQGNTAVIVEHDETIIREADHLIELGPGPGQMGGHIIMQGTIEDAVHHPESITGFWMKNPTIALPKTRHSVPNAFGIKGACKHNLKNIDVEFISPGIIAVTGVSGSGKSTLVHQVMYQSASRGYAIGCKELYGFERFAHIIHLDQQPFTGNINSTPATYSGVMDNLRDLYASTPDARMKKIGKSGFSYLHKDGKCPDCNGLGQKRTSMDFMNDVWTSCETCHGSRYTDKVLEIRLKSLNIADVLELTIDESLEKFRDYPSLVSMLTMMQQVGIGHLKLGQSSDTLSGGEAQRLRLATELLHHKSGRTLFLFDEPGTGLHAADIQRLINVFNRLADAGHTLLFIEHNPMLIAIANQVVNLGPGSGPEGGNLTA